VTKGVPVLVRKLAPLGDPVELTVRHYELSLRKDDCALIEVERQTDAGSRATPSR
ncbi:MAG TPA: ferrous iron transport protein A, partial [Bacillota bacterium]|nr:ferrous iron transport protein A [Bacillota bacterium]